MRQPQIGETWKHCSSDKDSLWLIVSDRDIQRVDDEPEEWRVQKGKTIGYNLEYFKNNHRWSFHSSKEHLFDELYIRMTK